MRLAHDRRHVRAPLARSSAGETLMEVLLAIVLMGIGFAAVLGGMFTSARIAQVNQRNTKAAQALQGSHHAAHRGMEQAFVPQRVQLADIGHHVRHALRCCG